MTLDEFRFRAAAERIGLAESAVILETMLRRMNGGGDLLGDMVTIARIQRAVSEYYGLPMSEMTSAKRAYRFSHPRQLAMYLARTLTPHSLPEIGRRFGGRDHTTVRHAFFEIERRRAENGDLDRDIRMITAVLAPATVRQTEAPKENI